MIKTIDYSDADQVRMDNYWLQKILIVDLNVTSIEYNDITLAHTLVGG